MSADKSKVMRLKQNLKLLLERKGLTAAGLARISSTPKQTLSDWLAGAAPKDLRAVKRVADALAVTVDRLCFADLTSQDASEFEKRLGDIHAGHYEVILRPRQRG